MNTPIRSLLFCSVVVILSALSLTVSAQTIPAATSFACGMAPLSADEARQLAEQGKAALLNKRNKDGNPPMITYVPIRPHIVRRTDGSGGFTLTNLNYVMALANVRFLQNGAGIQFYFAGSSPNYIDADSIYNRPFNDVSLLNTDAANAMNQYYVVNIYGASGYAYYPDNSVYTTRSVINFGFSDYDYIGSRLIPHELGHNFNLYHTFGSGPPNTPSNELVTRGPGANCQTAGDLICDTPADPWYQPGLQYDSGSDCPHYSPLSTPRDANGEPYQPMLSNIMSYFWLGCPHDFTPGQYERMQEGLALRQSHTAYTLDAPPTPMAAPSNVVVRAATTPLSVSVSWQDNSSSEMGYFIERATTSTGPFVPISGVGPDETTFVDKTVERDRHYYYRIRPSNTTTGQLSPVADVNLAYCRVTYANGCAGNNGLASVALNNVPFSQNSGCSVGAYGQFTAIATNLIAGRPTSFSVTLLDPSHPHGVTIWADLNRNFSIDLGEELYLSNGPQTGPVTGSFTIPTGTASGPLMVRVLAAYNTMPFYPCGTLNGNHITYEAGETEDYMVYVQQPPVSGLSTTGITGTVASLNWNSAGPGVTYDIQWRQQGNTTWNQFLTWTTTSVQLSSLQMNTVYEWQVRETNTVAYSGPVSFTTVCEIPNVRVVTPARITATLNWFTTSLASAGYTLRWRPVGSANWTTITGIPTYSAYSLTGLTASTPYEWQVQSNCSASVNSAFSPVQSFTTISCLGPYSASINYVLSNGAVVYWNGYLESGLTYRIRYRPVGTPTWQTVESLTTTSCTLTGLNATITYEWQVQNVCSPTESSPYFAGPNFTPVCSPPIYPFSEPTATGTNLGWQVPSLESNKTYDIQYRVVGTPDWTTLNSQTVVRFSSNSSYKLQGLATNTAYEWRIRAICPTGVPSDYTGISSFTTACLPVSQINIEDVSAQSVRLDWYHGGLEETTRFEIRYRVLGAPDWNTISNLTAGTRRGNYVLTGLTNNTTYEVQIRTVCSPTQSSTFTSVSITTSCRVPQVQSFVSSTTRVTSATLNWSRTGADVQYEVYYRPVGSATWGIASNIISTTVALSNLQANTNYEWQVRTLCGSGVVSDFSATLSFTTPACVVPFSYSVSISDQQATVGWNFYSASPDTRFELRWRAVGSPMWNSVAGLTVDVSRPGRYSLTGLTPGTAYEWQIRTFCSINQLTDFSNTISFQTLPPCNGQLYTIRTGAWTDPGVWSCNRVPLPTDVVQVRHYVYVSAGEVANALRIAFESSGRVFYYTGGRLKLGL